MFQQIVKDKQTMTSQEEANESLLLPKNTTRTRAKKDTFSLLYS
jgi:hypothetical protein